MNIETMYSTSTGAFGAALRRLAVQLEVAKLDTSETFAGGAVKARELSHLAVETATRWSVGESHDSLALFVNAAIDRKPTVEAMLIGGSDRLRKALERLGVAGLVRGSNFSGAAAREARDWSEWTDERLIIRSIDSLIVLDDVLASASGQAP